MRGEKITRHSASAGLEMLAGDVLYVSLRGPITGPTLSTFRAEIVARHGFAVRSFVVDYSAAVLAIDAETLDAVAGARDGAEPGLPSALVVRPDDLDLFAAHAVRLALRGIMRRVFFHRGQALRWATAQALRVRR